MKKKLFLLGITAAVFASCANEEVTDVASNRAIRFDQFVNNNTKATEVTTPDLHNYYVFGESGDVEGTYGTKNFNNELQTTTYYWVAGQYYSFGAYADGNNGQLTTTTKVSFDAKNGKLTFTAYTPNDAKDLVAAVKKTGPALADNNPAVDLSFKHMLSQVKFTFTTTDGDGYTIAISELKFSAVNKATGIYPDENQSVTWTSVDFNGTGDYIYGSIPDVAVAPNYMAESDSKLVIPQAATDQITVTFKATVSGPGLTQLDKTFTANLGVDAGAAGEGSAVNTWKPGYRYNYTAAITAANIISGLNKIEFTPTVESWEDATDQGTTPAVVPVP